MYQPVLGRFQSLDPVSPNGVDLLDDNNWFGRRLTRMQNLYGYVGNNPTNYTDPSGLVAIPPPTTQMPLPPGGSFICANRPTTQTEGRVTWDQTFTHNCKECTETCRIIVTANRCFHQSVKSGDDSSPLNFYTVFHVSFIRTNRKCGDEALPDEKMSIGGCRLYPGRLVFPGGPLNQALKKYLADLDSCNEFDFVKMCEEWKKVPPPEPTRPLPPNSPVNPLP